MSLVGIIGAMEEEVSQLKEQMTDVQIKKKAAMEFCRGNLNGKPVVVVRSGIGKVNAGICAQILVDDYQVDYMINTGIAGSLKNEINIGDIVVSTDTVQHDMDATGFGYPLGQIPRMDTLSFPADEKLVALAQEVCREVIPRFRYLPVEWSAETSSYRTGPPRSGSAAISRATARRWRERPLPRRPI